MPPVSRIECNAFMEWRDCCRRNHDSTSFPFTELSRRQQLLDILQSSFSPMKAMLERSIQPQSSVTIATPSSIFHSNQTQNRLNSIISDDASSLLRSFCTLSTLGDDALLLTSLDSWTELLCYSTQFLCLCALLHNDWSEIESLNPSCHFPPILSVQTMGIPKPCPATLSNPSRRDVLLNVLESAYLYVQNASEEELKESELLMHYGELIRSCCYVCTSKEGEEKPREEKEEISRETVEMTKEEMEDDVEFVYQGVATKQEKKEKEESGNVGVLVHHKELMEELKVFHASRQKKTKRVVVGEIPVEEPMAEPVAEPMKEEAPDTHVKPQVNFFSLLSHRGDETVIE